MNKKIKIEIAAGIIALIAIVLGVGIWIGGKKQDIANNKNNKPLPTQKQAQQPGQTEQKPVNNQNNLQTTDKSEASSQGVPWVDFSVDNKACITESGESVDLNGKSEIKLLINGKQVASVQSSVCPSGGAEIIKKDIDKIYFSIQPDGIGGYILFPTYANLYSFNLNSNEVEEIADLKGSDVGFSGNEDFIVYHTFETSDSEKGHIEVENIKTKEIRTYDIPSIQGNYQIGNFKFSPDENKIAFVVNYGPEKEHGEIYILDLQKKSYTLYAKANYLMKIDSWENNDKIVWSKLKL